MRTSHKRIHQMIADEKSKLTDQDIFSSKAYQAYLMDLVEVTTGRYKRKIKVRTRWDETPGADVAYTDNRMIDLNCGNYLTASYPTRELKHVSLIGLLGHEAAHILYTDFSTLALFMQAVDNGTMYPNVPLDLESDEQEYLERYLEVLKEKDEKVICIIKYVLHSIANILEDCYIEGSMCTDFPGKFKTGIVLNNVKLTEDALSVSQQVDQEIPPAAILMNMILQYARIGEYNNDGGYKGDLIDSFDSCIELIDEAIDKTDARRRYDCANRILIRMWPYVEAWIEEIKKDPSKTPQEVMDMLEALEKALGNPTGVAGGSKAPAGTGAPCSGRCKPDFSGKGDAVAEAQEVLEAEGGRLALTKTDSIEDEGPGGVEKNDSYAGSGYEHAVKDMERLLSSVAEDHAYERYNEELEEELQAESDAIRYGNAHKGVHIRINRMATVPESYKEGYKKIAPPLISVSKRLQKQILPKLKDESEGGRINGLLFGRRMNARSVIQDDGRIFYNKKYPDDEAKMAVAVLVDESGSMSWGDRVTTARTASIVMYDFCTSLGIPLAMYGHTETYDHSHPTVEIYNYTEFDNVDKNDRFRIMDMAARSNNRDGAALRFVAERLEKRPEKIKILIVISDGQPAASSYGGTEAEADLRGIKREYKKKGIMMFAAAIGDDKPNIERIYKEGFLDITDINKLPMFLTKLVVNYLKQI